MTYTEKCITAEDPNATPCQGEVEQRWSRSGYTSTFRCHRHEMDHQDILDGIDRRYPDSSFAPDWFDPTYAGESWDDDY